MKGITTWIVLGSLLLSGCDQKERPHGGIFRYRPAERYKFLRRLPVSMRHFPRPPRIPMFCLNTPAGCKNNLLKRDKSVDAQTERLYRIAAENGHYKASINLQNGALRWQFSLSSHEQFRLSQQLIAAGWRPGTI